MFSWEKESFNTHTQPIYVHGNKLTSPWIRLQNNALTSSRLTYSFIDLFPTLKPPIPFECQPR